MFGSSAEVHILHAIVKFHLKGKSHDKEECGQGFTVLAELYKIMDHQSMGRSDRDCGQGRISSKTCAETFESVLDPIMEDIVGKPHCL